MKVVVLKYQSLADIAIQITGGVDALLDIALANGISMTEELVPGQELVIPEDISGDVEIANYFKRKAIQVASLQDTEGLGVEGFTFTPVEEVSEPDDKIMALKGQTFADIVLQATGSINGLVDFCLANGISISATPVPGQIYRLPELHKDKKIFDYYQAHGIRPVTGVDAVESTGTQILFANGLFEPELFE